MTLTVEDSVFRFAEIESGGELIQRVWTVSPLFERYLEGLFGVSFEEPPVSAVTDTDAVVLPEDLPWMENGAVSSSVTEIDVPELLRHRGLIGEGENASVLRSFGSLILRADSKNLERVDGVTQQAAGYTPIQTRLRFSAGLNDTLEDLSALIVIPETTGELNMEGGIGYEENKREWVGSKIEVTAELYGFGEEIELSYDLSRASDGGPPLVFSGREKFFTNGPEARGREEVTEYLLTDQNGETMTLQIRSDRLDATGRVVPRKND